MEQIICFIVSGYAVVFLAVTLPFIQDLQAWLFVLLGVYLLLCGCILSAINIHRELQDARDDISIEKAIKDLTEDMEDTLGRDE